MRQHVQLRLDGFFQLPVLLAQFLDGLLDFSQLLGVRIQFLAQPLANFTDKVNNAALRRL